MTNPNTTYSSQDVADIFGVSIETARRTIDKLSLGRRIGGNRVLTHDDLKTLRIAFRALGYPKKKRQLAPVAEEAGASR
jgi:DeoR/GlpR family transcriptional regulator of sugar metabolism